MDRNLEDRPLKVMQYYRYQQQSEKMGEGRDSLWEMDRNLGDRPLKVMQYYRYQQQSEKMGEGRDSLWEMDRNLGDRTLKYYNITGVYKTEMESLYTRHILVSKQYKQNKRTDREMGRSLKLYHFCNMMFTTL